MADFVLVYTVLCRGVACRMECSQLRAGDSHTWRKNAKLSRQDAKSGRQNETPERGGFRAFQITQQRSNISRCFFHTRVCIPFLLLIAEANCAHLLSMCLREGNSALYSEAEPIKGRRNKSQPLALSSLHSILQATSLQRTVYTRTMSATTAHVE